MIVLFTDFGLAGPYTGQMKAVLHREAPGVPVIDLFADAPMFDPMSSAYLLAAYAAEFPAGTVFLCVVDPGVGSERAALVLQADSRWFVGPDNGLLAVSAAHARRPHRIFRVEWVPSKLSSSFHGRDLFAPVAAGLALGVPPAMQPVQLQACVGAGWPAELDRVVYVDVYGNAMIGRRVETLDDTAGFVVGGRVVHWARTFADVPPGAAFWYANANGLAEIAVNQGRASDVLGLGVGAPVKFWSPDVNRY